MTDPASPVSIVRQSDLLSVCRATLYYKPKRNVSTRVRHRGWKFRERFEENGLGMADEPRDLREARDGHAGLRG